jgi:AcrR family transcriptional regulator
MPTKRRSQTSAGRGRTLSAPKSHGSREPRNTLSPLFAPPQDDAKPRNAREVRSAARREAILSASFEEFSSRGFAAARLDDVARRAGVAKGTIYLYFADKEALFKELVRSMLTPLIGQFEALAQADIPFSILADRLVDVAAREVIGSRRRDIIRLIIAEGTRFPEIADFYYREILSRVFSALRHILQRSYERGEIRHRGLVEFPQLLAAPVLVAMTWTSLFEKQAPLDVHALLKAHLDILLDRGGA